MFTRVTSSYEHALAHVYHKIDKRGLLIDEPRLVVLRQEIENAIIILCNTLSSNWSIGVSVGKLQSSGYSSHTTCVNINSSSGSNSLLNTLKTLGYKVPSVRKKNKDKEWEMRESADELALQTMFADTGDINLKYLMQIKELVKLLGTYINAKLHRSTFYSVYGVASTVTGRRGCSKHPFGYGGNAQTFPSHTDDPQIGHFTHDYRRCIIARPNCVFFNVDQKSAEEWPVSALAGNIQALTELRSNDWPMSDRHTKLASLVFKVPVSTYTKKEWKDTSTPAGTMRYVGGKKARHANNYGMRKNRFSQELAKLGFSYSPDACQVILDEVDKHDPLVKKVFHQYVRDEVERTRTLVTPLGRERQFFSFRPNSENYDVWNEAYAWIPQSVVGDNTGMSVLELETTYNSHYIVNESHDGLAQEVPDKIGSLERVLLDTQKAFNRKMIFYNGIKIEIPIEASLSYNFEDSVSLKDYTIDALREAYKELKEKYGTTGQNMQPMPAYA